MVKLTINDIPVEVEEGMTVMEAAATIGISIPSMCHRPGFTNHPSCMVCLVKDAATSHLVPSCALPVSEGMNIVTDTGEVREARREALALLLSDHAGDCEAPCRLSCPAFLDIPLMNRLIAAGDFGRALAIVRQEIALPFVLGHICPAPCEKACKRKHMDGAVSVCLLKRAAAQYGETGIPVRPLPASGKKGAVIGTGPAGLSAAFYLLRSGYGCMLFDREEKPGGSLRYRVPRERLPEEILDQEIGVIRAMGAEFRMNTPVTKETLRDEILPRFDAVILAAGSRDKSNEVLFGLQPDASGRIIDKTRLTTSIPGVFACGNIVREQNMAVRAVAQGKLAAGQAILWLAKGNDEALLPGSSRNSSSVSATGHLPETGWKEYLQESSPGGRLEPSGGCPAGFTREEAMQEAARCLHCDCRKPESCKLRMYAVEYDAAGIRFAGGERKAVERLLQHERVVYEPGKCIRCGLCVEITERQKESTGLAFAGRGFEMRISVPFGETVKEALAKAAGMCVEACPTGALAFRDSEERDRI